LPLGYASRTAAIAPRHGLAGLVPYSTPATQRTVPESGSRHFYKKAAAPRVGWRLLVFIRFQSTDWTARSAGCSIRRAQLGSPSTRRLGGSSFDDRLDSCRLREAQACQPTHAENLFRFQLSF